MSVESILKQHRDEKRRKEPLSGAELDRYNLYKDDTWSLVLALCAHRHSTQSSDIRTVFEAIDMGKRRVDSVIRPVVIQPRTQYSSGEPWNPNFTIVELEVLSPRNETEVGQAVKVFNSGNSEQLGLVSLHFGLEPTQKNFDDLCELRGLLDEAYAAASLAAVSR